MMLFREIRLSAVEELNTRLLERFMELRGTDRISQTHYFGDRFENIYIDRADIPDIVTVLDALRAQAGGWLDRPPESLRVGFWFNAMESGQRTAPHHHDENDELLSAVYYIRVPENSGNLILYEDDSKIEIEPEEGKLVMFPPSVLHEVTGNRGTGLRLSVGMNVGPVDDPGECD
jgi:hypothetical protein